MGRAQNRAAAPAVPHCRVLLPTYQPHFHGTSSPWRMTGERQRAGVHPPGVLERALGKALLSHRPKKQGPATPSPATGLENSQLVQSKPQ